jgi:hypothetical protein
MAALTKEEIAAAKADSPSAMKQREKAYNDALTTTAPAPAPAPTPTPSVKKMAKGGSASSRADGIAQRGKTRGKMV